MAGDWMKIELELPDKPEVHGIAGMLNLDPDCVVGKLLRVWQWFDKHTTDGNAFGVTYSLLDRISGVTGFGEAMAFVGWLEQRDKVLHMPKFDRHTSESAKKRALTGKRVKRLRNADDVTKALPEKRREEKKESGPRKRKRTDPNETPCPQVFDVTQPMSDWALSLGLPADRIMLETDQFLDKAKSKGWTALDWDATWRTWMRNAVKFGGFKPQPGIGT